MQRYNPPYFPSDVEEKILGYTKDVRSYSSTSKRRNITKDKYFKEEYIKQNKYNFKEWLDNREYWLIEEYLLSQLESRLALGEQVTPRSNRPA